MCPDYFALLFLAKGRYLFHIYACLDRICFINSMISMIAGLTFELTSTPAVMMS